MVPMDVSIRPSSPIISIGSLGFILKDFLSISNKSSSLKFTSSFFV